MCHHYEIKTVEELRQLIQCAGTEDIEDESEPEYEPAAPIAHD
jgi:hypothetical protein